MLSVGNGHTYGHRFLLRGVVVGHLMEPRLQGENPSPPLGLDNGGTWCHHPLEGVVVDPRFLSVADGL